MKIIGATINSGEYSEIEKVIEERRREELLEIAGYQLKFGAEMLDINAGASRGTEVEDIIWLIKTIQDEYDIPLSLDSSDPEVFYRGLEVYNNQYGQPLINSVTAEREKLDKTLPLLRDQKLPFVVLLMDEEGIPGDLETRIEIAERVLEITEKNGISVENIYFDPLIFPVAVESEQAGIGLDTVITLKEKFPGIKTICGLNNISHGLPERDLINATYLSMMAATGLDAVLIEITEVISAFLQTIDLLQGKDQMAGDYLQAYRDRHLSIFKEQMSGALPE